MSFLDHDYDPMYQRFKMVKFSNLRLYYDQCYAFKILKGFIKDDNIRSLFNPRVLSHNLRNPTQLNETHTSSNYHFYSPFPRMFRN